MSIIRFLQRRFSGEDTGNVTLADHQIKMVPKDSHRVKRYSPEEFKNATEVKYLSHISFHSMELKRKARRRCPWSFRFGFWGMEWHPLYDHYRDQIARGYVADVSIKWIDDVWGYGVYANRNFDTGSFIGTYTGILRPLSQRWPDHNSYCLHYPTSFWSMGRKLIVDAQAAGNETRFLNHSDAPNLDLNCLYANRLLHFFFTARAPICKGSHLTFNYGDSYWHDRSKAQD